MDRRRGDRERQIERQRDRGIDSVSEVKFSIEEREK